MLFILVGLLLPFTEALENGLGRTPQMGWNTWNHFNCDINATVIKGAADAIVAHGLDELGYKYVNIDDCWALLARDTDGRIVPDPVKFPEGISGVADYVHFLGLKLGIYSDAGSKTCQGQPGSLDNEEIDAASFASWGVDYLKYDNCHNRGIAAQLRYPPMQVALNKTGRPIFYSICEWGEQSVAKWAGPISNSWRTTIDIEDRWESMKLNYYLNSLHADKAGPGHWNDPDMLEVGNGGMSTTEYLTHFSLWAIAKAPLILGSDLTKLDEETYRVIANPEVIAINQDALGVQAVCKLNCGTDQWLGVGGLQVWTSPLANGDTAVAVVNWSLAHKKIELKFKDLGLEGSYTVRDLWARTDLNIEAESLLLEVVSHGARLIRLTPN